MKQNLLIHLFLIILFTGLLSKQSKAQYFAPIGAKWTYNYSLYGFGTPPPYTIESLSIEVVKDTSINGLACRELEILIPSPLNTIKKYIRSINDRVLVYSSVNNRFNLLYDFNANIGDTLLVYYDDFDLGNLMDSALVEIDSIGFKNIKGINYRAYHQKCLVNISSCPERSTGWIIDSIGMIEYGDQFSYLFPAMNISGNVISGLRCYTDNNSNYNYDNTNCDTTYIVTSINDISFTNLNVYPSVLESNNRKIMIETSNNTPTEIQFISLTGVAVPTKIKLQENKAELTISSNIPKGVYLLNFKLNQTPITKKIIVL